MKQALTNLINALADCIRPTPPCKHKWKKWATVEVTNDYGELYHIFHLQCTECGGLQKVKSD